jgi:hypothetical protein
MASYRGHLAFSSALGAGYGGLAIWYGGVPAWGAACLGAGLTTLGGLLPDLDSDSGVPVRELFGVGAAALALSLYPRLAQENLSTEQILALIGGVYLFVRYGLSRVFKGWTVHRGMYHSLPAMLIAGLAVYLLYPHSPGRPPLEDLQLRVYLAGGVMLGFFSHLLLDELYSVDLMGLRLRLNKYAGSALKFTSKSWPATLTTYGLLLLLALTAWLTHPDLSTLPGVGSP